jgi:hypothetical protein
VNADALCEAVRWFLYSIESDFASGVSQVDGPAEEMRPDPIPSTPNKQKRIFAD